MVCLEMVECLEAWHGVNALSVCVSLIGIKQHKQTYRVPAISAHCDNTEELSLWHVPSTFATVNTHANVFFVFLPGGISKEWRHIVSANCDFQGNYFADIVSLFTGLSRNTWGDQK